MRPPPKLSETRVRSKSLKNMEIVTGAKTLEERAKKDASPVDVYCFLTAPESDWTNAIQNEYIYFQDWEGDMWFARCRGVRFELAKRGDFTRKHTDTIIKYKDWEGNLCTARRDRNCDKLFLAREDGTTRGFGLTRVIEYLSLGVSRWSSQPLSGGVSPSVTWNPLQDIRLLTYSFSMRPLGFTNNGNDYKSERLDEFAPLIAEFDIVCLQDFYATGTNRRSRLLERAHKQGLFFHVESLSSKSSMLTSHKLLDCGLIILSKYPIKDFDGIQFNASAGGWAPCGVLHAVIQLGEVARQSIHVFNAQLCKPKRAHAGEMDADQRPVDIDWEEQKEDAALEEVRHNQLLELWAFIDSRTNGTEYPIFVVGDLGVDARRSDVGDEDEDWRFPSSPYRKILKILDPSQKIRDLVKESHGGSHPVTYGTGEMLPNGERKPEDVLTHKDDQLTYQCRDYILRMHPVNSSLLPQTKSIKSPTRRSSVSASAKDFWLESHKGGTLVEQFHVEWNPDFTSPYTQLSDHYGVSTVLRLVRHAKVDLKQIERAVSMGDLISDDSDPRLGSPVHRTVANVIHKQHAAGTVWSHSVAAFQGVMDAMEW